MPFLDLQISILEEFASYHIQSNTDLKRSNGFIHKNVNRGKIWYAKNKELHKQLMENIKGKPGSEKRKKYNERRNYLNSLRRDEINEKRRINKQKTKKGTKCPQQ